MAWQLWVLALLGLAGTNVSLRSQRLDFFHNETEQSHLVVDETRAWCTWGQAFVFTPINLASMPPILLCVHP